MKIPSDGLPATDPAFLLKREGRKRILVVDDDPADCALMAATLRSAGHKVAMAEDGEAAWMVLLSDPCDLLITDHLMPKVSGLALARRIRVAHLPVQVILTSDRLEAADTVNISHDPWSRIDAFIHKPFTGSELLAEVRGLWEEEDRSPAPLKDISRPGIAGHRPADHLPNPGPAREIRAE